MATKTELDALLKNVPLADLAERFGVDQGTVEAAVRQALPGLVGGMAVNASESEGARKLERAVQQHAPAEKPALRAIDTADGEKIVGHVLGDKQGEVARALGEQSGDSGIADLIPKLLPILAPIVMQFLAAKLGGGSGAASTGQQSGGGLGGVLGDLLGGLLGGGQTSQQQQSGGDLGDLLGGLLGGGKSGSSGGSLGDLLGGLLGK